MTKYNRIEIIVKRLGYPEYRVGQIYDAIFKRKVTRYADMFQLPEPLRAALIAELGANIIGVSRVTHSLSVQTDKTLFELHDGCAVEAVALRYKRGWNSFCISSQCGCACGCKFCATGGMGFRRNMTADEITDQVLYFLKSGRKLDSISFMGMGEPLLNPETFTALGLLTDARLFGLSQRRITVSTVGIVPGIKRLTAEFPNVNLAFSLHAPTDGVRRDIMPIDGKYRIADVFSALDAHIAATNRRVFLAYIMLSGVNDKKADALRLAELIRGRGEYRRLYHVDLIPYNKTRRGLFDASPIAHIREFCEILRRRGISVSVRTQFGSDVDAACGQLATGEEK